MYEFNNFDYDSDTKSDNTVDFNDLLFESETSVMNATEIRKMESAESELAEMEEDGGLTMISLVILALIISLLALYILYWFCCSASSKGYRQSSQFVSGGITRTISTIASARVSITMKGSMADMHSAMEAMTAVATVTLRRMARVIS